MARTVAATAVDARSLICVNPLRAAHPTADRRARPMVEATVDIMDHQATADRMLLVMAVVDIRMVEVVVTTAVAAVVADTPEAEVGATEAVEVMAAVAAIDRVRDIRMSRSSSKLLYPK